MIDDLLNISNKEFTKEEIQARSDYVKIKNRKLFPVSLKWYAFYLKSDYESINQFSKRVSRETAVNSGTICNRIRTGMRIAEERRISDFELMTNKKYNLTQEELFVVQEKKRA